MCGPEGEALRQQLANTLNALKQDNRYVVNAMLNSGMEVPDSCIEAGLNYVPSRHESNDQGQPVQAFYGMKAMMESGEFSCGDGAALEAAVMEEKYGIPTEVLCVATSDADYHGVFVTPEGVVDPVENWLRHFEAEMAGTPETVTKQLLPKPRQQDVEALGANCHIVDGRVQCEVEEANSCVVDPETGLWRCPNPALDGQPCRIAKVYSGDKTNQRWAHTEDGLVVPVAANVRPKRRKQLWKGGF